MSSPVIRCTLFVACLICVTPHSAPAQHDYKVSRNLIREGKLAEALQVLDDRRTRFPDDSEWIYQSAIAHAQLGHLDQAIENLQQAVEMGVWQGRLLADAHDLLKPVAEQPAFLRLTSVIGDTPVQGPMLGMLRDTSVGVWLRTAREASVQVFAVPSESNEQAEKVESAIVQTDSATDFVAKLHLEGLRPATRYDYHVASNGKSIEFPYPTQFTTRPAETTGTRLSLAFGGGSGYVTQHERMWDTIGSFRPEMLLLLGDNMYSDDPESSQMQRFCYYRRQSPLPFRSLVASIPVYSIWDDHDFGTNDCSGGPEIDRPAWKRPVWEVFCQNWLNPGFGQGEDRPGCWYDFHVGDIHFIMLDGRMYRTPGDNTMLGPHQKAWLKDTLLSSQATFRVIASPVPFEYRTKGDSRDTWNGFKQERDEIFSFLAEHRIDGVILMSADRHRSDAWRIERPHGYALYEFNSSRLTNNHVHPIMREAIFSYNAKQSFGLVQFDTTVADPTVLLTVVSIDGEPVHQLLVRRSQLQHAE